jgi:hypothetical protein
MIYAINPKNYTKYINYIMQKKKKKKHRKKFLNENLTLLNYKDLPIKKKLILKNNQINFVKK